LGLLSNGGYLRSATAKFFILKLVDAQSTSPLSAEMEQVYINDKTEFGTVALYESKNQNKYGVMYYLPKKIDLITTDFVGDYHVFHSENSKIYLCIDSGSQMGIALEKLQEALTREKGFAFKPNKKSLYIRMIDVQEADLPRFQNLLISVNVYGVFLQASSNTAFLQYELTAFKASPRINFDPVNDNAVFP
jgi:hypothetical protein